MYRRSLSLIVLMCALGVDHVWPQCTAQFDLGNDTTLCEGSSLLISAPAGFQTYLWNDGGGGTTRTTTQPGIYQCTATDFGTSGELVANGTFSAGATGFNSDYVPGMGGTYGLLSFEGTYGVATSPQLLHTNFDPCGDHTTGSGNMLVVNGSQTAGSEIWCQTVNVQPNTDYAFSAWLTSAFFDSPAQLQFTVNGVPIGAGLDATFQTCNWDNFYAIWASGPATTATICITNLNTSNSGNDFALDDISFAPFCTYTDQVVVTYQDFPEPDLGPDLTPCEEEPVQLNAAWPAADTYSWQDGSSAPTLAPSASGIYWVDVTESGCRSRDSVLVEFQPRPEVDLGPDQTLCEGESITLSAANQGATYTWQDGSTSPEYLVSEQGLYSVTAALDDCTDFDQVQIDFDPLPIVQLGNDTTLCADAFLTFNVARAGGTYLWNDGTTSPMRTSNGPGIYAVTVTESGCSSVDSLLIEEIPLPTVDLGADFLLCVGTTEILDASGPDYNYIWQDGTTESRYIVSGPGAYGVVVSNACGQALDEVLVDQGFCDCPVFVPNSFTPDGDVINDGFRPLFDCPQRGYSFRIFDRWGGEIWSTNDPLQGWKADPDIAIGIYAWTLELRPVIAQNDGLRRLAGHVMLLR